MTIHKKESPTLRNYFIAQNRTLKKVELLLLVLLLYRKDVSRSSQKNYFKINHRKVQDTQRS